MDRQTILELVQPKKDLWEKSFKDIRVMLLTIGFPGSGSSLVGYLLTAHPNIVMADEPSVYRHGKKISSYINDINGIKLENIDCLYSAEFSKMFNVIFSLDYVRWLRAKMRNSSKENEPCSFDKKYAGDSYILRRYILIPNQYQGCFKSPKVIGVKHSRDNVECISATEVLKIFKKRLEEKGIYLKFILTVRNPYDMISVRLRKTISYQDFLQKKIKTNPISFIERLSKNNMKILKQVDSKDVFVSKHEEMVADPSLQLTKLCEFLQVPAFPDYLNSCASYVDEKPHRRRFQFDWTSEQKEKVASLIEQYDFFSGYDWES